MGTRPSVLLLSAVLVSSQLGGRTRVECFRIRSSECELIRECLQGACHNARRKQSLLVTQPEQLGGHLQLRVGLATENRWLWGSNKVKGAEAWAGWRGAGRGRGRGRGGGGRRGGLGSQEGSTAEPVKEPPLCAGFIQRGLCEKKGFWGQEFQYFHWWALGAKNYFCYFLPVLPQDGTAWKSKSYN